MKETGEHCGFLSPRDLSLKELIIVTAEEKTSLHLHTHFSLNFQLTVLG